MAPKGRGSVALTRIIVLIGVLVCAAALKGFIPTGTPMPGVLLTSGTDFSLSGDVGDLAPGDSSSLVLTAANPQPAAIVVTSVTVSVPAPPAGCPTADLTLGGNAFTGTPPAATVAGLSQAVPAGGSASVPLPIMLARDAPSGCQSVTFPFDYTGTASYGPPPTPPPTPSPATVTVLSVHPALVRLGHPVTFSIAVTGGHGTPAGTVRLYLCTRPRALAPGSASRCRAAVALGRAMVLSRSGTARLRLSALPPGRHVVFASFRPARATGYAPSLSRTSTVTVTGTLRFCGRSGRCPAAAGSR
jgi:hypothetical protein